MTDRANSVRLVILAGIAALSAACGGGGGSTGPPIDTVGPASKIAVVSGAGQLAAGGSTVQPITIKVTDDAGHGKAGITVTVAATAGEGSASASATTTDANGQVIITWRLGKSAIPQTLTVVANSSITTTISATVATSYTVDVRFFGPAVAPDVAAAFTNAAARIDAIITGDLADVSINTRLDSGSTNCGVPVNINETVDDVVIYVTVKTIDGVGKILAQSGPCLIRNSSRLTVVGVMDFDVDDVNNLQTRGQLQSVVLHEMLHVVGVGTLWDQKSPSLIVGAGGTDPRFTGTTGTQACTDAGGTTLCAGGVAVENCVGLNNCGAGTRDSHWREGTTTLPGFHAELMTGFIEGLGVVMPLSNITVKSLGDLGYIVNSFSADDYTVIGPSLRALIEPSSDESTDPFDHVIRPRSTISQSGKVVRLANRQ